MILTNVTPTNLVKGNKCAQRFKHIVTPRDWRHKRHTCPRLLCMTNGRATGWPEPPWDKPSNLLPETHPTVNLPVSQMSSQPHCAGPPRVTGSALQVTACRCDCFQNQFSDSAISLLGSTLAHMHTCAVPRTLCSPVQRHPHGKPERPATQDGWFGHMAKPQSRQRGQDTECPEPR